jgi:hypothetical protein
VLSYAQARCPNPETGIPVFQKKSDSCDSCRNSCRIFKFLKIRFLIPVFLEQEFLIPETGIPEFRKFLFSLYCYNGTSTTLDSLD